MKGMIETFVAGVTVVAVFFIETIITRAETVILRLEAESPSVTGMIG